MLRQLFQVPQYGLNGESRRPSLAMSCVTSKDLVQRAFGDFVHAMQGSQQAAHNAGVGVRVSTPDQRFEDGLLKWRGSVQVMKRIGEAVTDKTGHGVRGW